MSHRLWDNYVGNYKYHLTNWKLVTIKKKYGGLGIPNIREHNLCLLTSRIRRYGLDDNKLWNQIIDFKYDTES
jgi:hypothetical protein